MRRILFGLTAISAMSAAPGFTQDLLKQQEKLQAVAVQRVDGAIRDAISEAQRLQASGSTVRAAERLRQALVMTNDPILPTKNVEAWRKQLNDGIRSIESGKKPEVVSTGTGGKAEEAARMRAKMEEEQTIRRGVDTVAALMKAGSLTQARAEIAALEAKYGSNPTVAALPGLVDRSKTIEDIRAIHVKQYENIRAELNNLVRLGTLPKTDYELPKDWREITERRTTKLSPQLQAVLNSLKAPVNIDLKNAPFTDVLKVISEQIKQPIILEKETLKEAGIDQSSLSTCQPGTAVSGRTALRIALASHGLTYIIKNNTIHVVTRDAASRTMETRTYYIGDLITGTGPITGGAPRLGVAADEAQRRQNVEAMIKLIKDSVDPASWRGGGSDGKGEITFFPAGNTLVIKASAEVHGLLANTLNK